MRRCILNAGIPVFNHRLQDESLDRGEGLVLFDVQRLEAGGREVGLKLGTILYHAYFFIQRHRSYDGPHWLKLSDTILFANIPATIGDLNYE